MTYEQLLQMLLGLKPDQLQMSVTIWVLNQDEYYPVEDFISLHKDDEDLPMDRRNPTLTINA